jgi:AraC family transcriptional regulator
MTMCPPLPGSIDAELSFSNVSVGSTTWVWEGVSRPYEDTIDEDYLVLLRPPSIIGSYVRVGNAAELAPPSNVGTISFWPAGTRFRTDGSLGQLSNLRCAFRGNWFRRLSGFEQPDTAAELQANLDVRNEAIKSLMLRVDAELSFQRVGANAMLEGLSLEIAAELARHLRSRKPADQPCRQTLTPWQVRRVREYFETFTGYIPDPSELAELCGISPRHFRRLFRETTGQTLNGYARIAWIKRAKRLLSTWELDIKSAAIQLGFSSANAFSTAFKNASGITPTEYRREALASFLPSSITC